MGFRNLASNINQGLQGMTPQQRAQMLAIAGGASPSPQMGQALYGQSQSIMQALQDEARLKAQAAAQEQELVFRGREGALNRASDEAQAFYGAGDLPSNVREWEYYSKLTPEEQQQYREMKRAGNVVGLGGGGFGYLDPGAAAPRQVVAPSEATARDAERARQLEIAKGLGGLTVAGQDPAARADLQGMTLANTVAEQEAKKALESRAIAVAAKDDAKNLIDEILTMDITGVYGSVQSRFPTVRQGTANAESAISRLGNLLTLENLGKMSGVLTDRDMAVLANAASEIQNFKIDETRAESELRRIKTILEKASGGTANTAPSTAPKDESYEQKRARLLQ
jgi:hypothetical protein